MSEQMLTEILEELLLSYRGKGDMKELCINLQKSGHLTIGGRSMLISEISEKQPYEKTIGCIQIVFACSSDSMFAEKVRDNISLTDKLREILTNEESGEFYRQALSNLAVESFLSIAPMLKKISFENKW